MTQGSKACPICTDYLNDGHQFTVAILNLEAIFLVVINDHNNALANNYLNTFLVHIVNVFGRYLIFVNDVGEHDEIFRIGHVASALTDLPRLYPRVFFISKLILRSV
jgi:hypothetical protein